MPNSKTTAPSVATLGAETDCFACFEVFSFTTNTPEAQGVPTVLGIDTGAAGTPALLSPDSGLLIVLASLLREGRHE